MEEGFFFILIFLNVESLVNTKANINISISMKANIKRIIVIHLLLVASPVYALYLEEQVKLKEIAFADHDKYPVRYDAQMPQPVFKGEVLVKFKKGVTSSGAKITASSRAMSVSKEFKLLSQKMGYVYLLLRSDILTTKEMIETLKKVPAVKKVSPNYMRKICDTFPNDVLFDQLWGLHNTGQEACGFGGIPDADIDAPGAWDTNTGSSDVIVAVIDTGVDYTHEDLADNMWINDSEANGIQNFDDDGNGYVDDIYGYDFASDYDGNNDSDPMDIHYHGTHVAGTIAAAGNNSIGVVGVNWDARIMAIKGMRPDQILYDSDVIEAIEYIVHMKTNHGVNVVALNASWGGEDYNELLQDAIDAAGDVGIVFVAAAGNNGTNNDLTSFYPCAYDSANILCVAATDQGDNLAWFSNYGVTSVDLAAPGDGILSTVPGYTPGVGDLFFDDMESGNTNWVHGGINDSWAITEEYSFSPTHAWSDSPDGNYLDFTDSYIMLSDNIDLSGNAGENLMLGFWARADLEFYFDYLNVDISNDAGASWQTITSLTGYSTSWYLYSYSIPVDYRTSQFRFRFRLITYFNTGDGVYIDDVGIGSGGGAYECLPGTSMAAPHVTGAVALMAAEYPGEDLNQRMDRILSGVDALPSLDGQVVTGGRLNLANSINGGITTCACDVNGDGEITPNDALCAFQKYLGTCPTSCGDCEDICCDVNGDSQCTPGDALCIFQEYLGIGCDHCN